MSHQQPTLDLSGLTVETIEVVPATSLDTAAYGHGMPELAASCGDGACGPCAEGSSYLPDDWDEV